MKTPCSCIICRRKINARRTVIDQHWQFHQRTGLAMQNTQADKKRRRHWRLLDKAA